MINTQKQIAINIMEELVNNEIERQFKCLPENIKQNINKIEVATFALNRLPALYASCHKGLNKQKLKGKSKFSVQVTRVVRQAFAIIQEDILRSSSPLQPETDVNPEQISELEEAKRALAELSDLLPSESSSWTQVVAAIKPMLANSNGIQIEDFEADSEREELESRLSNLWENDLYVR